MESDFYNEEFEELIRQKTDQYKMYPSEKVWKGIYNSLHTRRRRFIAGMSVLITGILFLAGKELLMPGTHTAPVKKTADIIALLKAGDTISSTPFLSDVSIHATSHQSYGEEENNLAPDQPATPALTQQQIALVVPITTNNALSVLESAGNIIENTSAENIAIAKPATPTSTQAIEKDIKTISPEELVNRENAEE